MAVDYEALHALRQTYQARCEDVGQAWIEHWDDPTTEEVEAAKAAAGIAWLVAIHAAWPEIYEGRPCPSSI